MLKTTLAKILTSIAFVSCLCSALNAEEKKEDKPSKGLLPLPDYSGSFSERTHLLGDLGGIRTDLAEKGLTIDVNFLQYLQGVNRNGDDQGSRYGGQLKYDITLDLDRMGVMPGGLLQIQAMSRYGSSVNGISGSAMPVNSSASAPTTANLDDDVDFYIPKIVYTQFLSKNFALTLGKITTYAQTNEFSSGEGDTQFMNLNFVAPISPALFIPYSLLGGGAVVMPTSDLSFTFLVGTSGDTSNHSGFHYIDDGRFALGKVSYQYNLDGLPGGFTNQFAYGWDNEFNEINGRLIIEESDLSIKSTDTTWMNSFDVWQYLFVEEGQINKVDISNGKQDLQGVGIFSRIQFADKDTNPLDYVVSLGLNGKGLIDGRDNDTMGIAYNYSKFQDSRFVNSSAFDGSTSAWEVFYNIELTPAIHLTMDVQVIDSAGSNIDTSLILGSRLQITF